MERRLVLGGLAVTGLAALAACSKPAPPPAPVVDEEPLPQRKRVEDLKPYSGGPDTVKVSLMTEKGEIVLLLEARKAPYTVNNFLHYVDTGKLDGATFWRASNQGGVGFIQATASGIKYPGIPHEPTTQTGLSHTNGTISMARFDVGTASNEFTISVGDQTYLDAGHDPKGDNLGYAAFGHVIKGMNVVRAILNARIDKHDVPGGWKGQMLAKPIKILTAKRLDTPPEWEREVPPAEAASESASS